MGPLARANAVLLAVAGALCVLPQPPVPPPSATPANRWSEGTREILRPSCGRCHLPNLPTSNPRALAIFNLSDDVWYAGMTAEQFGGLERRIAGNESIADEDKATVASFVRCARDGDCGGGGSRAAGASRRDRAGIAQVWVPAGSFRMGTEAAAVAALRRENPPAWVAGAIDAEAPAHDVRLSNGYWIDTYEVTNEAFAAFVADGGYGKSALWSDDGWAWVGKQAKGSLPAVCAGTAPRLPRRCITWFEAEAYARWRGGRLPTEAEWEFAARGPEARRYPWGNDFDPAKGNVVESTGAVEVGSYSRGTSWVGALDMAGNAMEWVQDWRAPYHGDGVAVDPAGPASGTVKVEKGGWWGSNRFVARSAYRHFEDPPDYQDHHIGFRVVTPEP